MDISGGLTREAISEGDDVLLFLNSRRSFLVKVRRGVNFHTHKGYILLDCLIGRCFGERVKTHLGVEFIAFKPTVFDRISKLGHATQIIYPKDAAMILRHTGVGPGSRVVEAGTGSGALTITLAHFIRPNGRIYSYEIRPESREMAERNILRAGMSQWIELKSGDITQGIEERGVDAVVLDLATPWLAVKHSYDAMQGSGSIVSFSPTVEQVVNTVEALAEAGFVEIETEEYILRKIKVMRGETRPETLMIGHTGYVTHARKAERPTQAGSTGTAPEPLRDEVLSLCWPEPDQPDL